MAATTAVKPAAAAASSSHVDGHDEALPAPRSHLLLLLLSLAPAFLPIPANANIVATASLAVFVGCWRSVKQEAPTESMTRKVRTMMKGKGKRERSFDRSSSAIDFVWDLSLSLFNALPSGLCALSRGEGVVHSRSLYPGGRRERASEEREREREREGAAKLQRAASTNGSQTVFFSLFASPPSHPLPPLGLSLSSSLLPPEPIQFTPGRHEVPFHRLRRPPLPLRRLQVPPGKPGQRRAHALLRFTRDGGPGRVGAAVRRGAVPRCRRGEVLLSRERAQDSLRVGCELYPGGWSREGRARETRRKEGGGETKKKLTTRNSQPSKKLQLYSLLRSRPTSP